jgi:hypothetical protein
MADEQKLYETMLAGLLDWVWGKGKADIQRQLQQATPDTLPTVIGHIVFALVQQGAEQGAQAGHDLSMDLLMGVATELIESLEKMAAALGADFDAQAVALQALTQALNDYAQSLPDGSEAQQEAQNALKDMGQGDMDEAASTLSTIGQRNGVDPFAASQQQGQVQGQPAQSGPAPAGQPQSGLMGAAQ